MNKKGRVLVLLMAALLLYGSGILSLPEEASAAILPVPTSFQYFKYPAVIQPAINADPAIANPLGVGVVATGGNTLSLRFATEQFAGPVDIYLVLYIPDLDPNNLYLFTSGNSVQTLAQGFAAWKTNITGSVDEAIWGDIPVAGFPTARYYLYVLVTPHGSADKYYLWETNFTVTQAGITFLTPTEGVAGTQISIVGKGFTESSKVTIEGLGEIPMTYLSPSNIRATVPFITDGSGIHNPPPGDYNLSVDYSAAATFKIKAFSQTGSSPTLFTDAVNTQLQTYQNNKQAIQAAANGILSNTSDQDTANVLKALIALMPGIEDFASNQLPAALATLDSSTASTLGDALTANGISTANVKSFPEMVQQAFDITRAGAPGVCVDGDRWLLGRLDLVAPTQYVNAIQKVIDGCLKVPYLPAQAVCRVANIGTTLTNLFLNLPVAVYGSVAGIRMDASHGVVSASSSSSTIKLNGTDTAELRPSLIVGQTYNILEPMIGMLKSATYAAAFIDLPATLKSDLDVLDKLLQTFNVPLTGQTTECPLSFFRLEKEYDNSSINLDAAGNISWLPQGLDTNVYGSVPTVFRLPSIETVASDKGTTTVYLTRDMWLLNIYVQGDGKGSVSVTPDMKNGINNCAKYGIASCQAAIPDGWALTLTATPKDSNSVFDGWTGNGLASCQNDKSGFCTFVMDKSYEMQANFKGSSRYIDNGNGTVTDSATGLTWQQGYGGPSTWDQAFGVCGSLSLAGGGWRLPTKDELIGVSSGDSTTLDNFFYYAGGCWSSTTYAYGTDVAWYVHFGNGLVSIGHKSFDGYVRCVRG